jgi:hypothetical protein
VPSRCKHGVAHAVVNEDDLHFDVVVQNVAGTPLFGMAVGGNSLPVSSGLPRSVG